MPDEIPSKCPWVILFSSPGWDGHEVTVILASDIQNQTQYNWNGHLFQIWRNSQRNFRRYCIYPYRTDRLSLLCWNKNREKQCTSSFGVTLRVMWSVNRINQEWKINQIKQLIALLMSLFVCRWHSHPAIQQAPIILIIFQITTPNLSQMSFQN